MKRVACALCVLLAGLATWTFWWEPNSLIARQVELSPARWPAALDGLKIVQITDLHVGAPWVGLKKLRKVVALSNAQNPDLIVLTGDYVELVLGGEEISPEAIASELAALKAPLGVYAVLGNHDWRIDGRRVKKALTDAGLTVLDDAAIGLNYRNSRFWLMGIGDYGTGHSHWRQTLSRVAERAAIIAITHNPDVFTELPQAITLTLAGHTHGGQVRLPLLWRLFLPSQYGSRYARGIVTEQGRTLFISTGIGTTLLPARLGVTPEIAVLHLHADTKAVVEWSSP